MSDSDIRASFTHSPVGLGRRPLAARPAAALASRRKEVPEADRAPFVAEAEADYKVRYEAAEAVTAKTETR